MKIAAYSLRVGGPRTYEHGIVDIGAVVLNDDSFESEFYRLCTPSDNQSYRPGAMRMFGVTLEKMEAEGELPGLASLDFFEWANEHSGVWTLGHDLFPSFLDIQLRQNKGVERLQNSACVLALYNCLKALGARGPALRDKYTLMDYAGVDCREFESRNALEQAKATALTMRHLRDKLTETANGGSPLIRA